jgi:hypothetical protein
VTFSVEGDLDGQLVLTRPHWTDNLRRTPPSALSPTLRVLMLTRNIHAMNQHVGRRGSGAITFNGFGIGPARSMINDHWVL